MCPSFSHAVSSSPPPPPLLSQPQRGTSSCYHGSSATSSYSASFGLGRRLIRVASGLLATVLILVSGTASEHKDHSHRCDLFVTLCKITFLGCRSSPMYMSPWLLSMTPMGSRTAHITAVSRSNLAFGVAARKSS